MKKVASTSSALMLVPLFALFDPEVGDEMLPF
jgi:hypothetical protein